MPEVIVILTTLVGLLSNIGMYQNIKFYLIDIYNVSIKINTKDGSKHVSSGYRTTLKSFYKYTLLRNFGGFQCKNLYLPTEPQ